MRAPSQVLVIAGLAIAASLGTSLGGCGGAASDTPPGPLARHFDDMYIAAIPPGQKPAVVQSQNDWAVARMEVAKAEADLAESATQLSIAQNDVKRAQLDIDSAVSAKKSAEAAADKNRINDAVKNLHNAEDVGKAAEARVRYVEAYRAYLRVALRGAQETMYWREAQFELAKSQVGQHNNIAPKGVAFEDFPKQEQDRARRASSAKGRLDSERSRAMGVRDSWMRAQETADRETGRPANYPDPLMAKSGATGSSR